MVRRSSALALGIAIACAWVHPSAARTIDFPDLRTEVSVSTPVISPDGKSIAVVVSKADFDKDMFVNQLMLVDVATGSQRALTQGRDDVNSPAWSPTGDRIAFIAANGSGDDATDQVYVLSMNGGDPIAASASKTDVQEFVWSPDGTRIAYVAADQPPKLTGTAKYDNPFRVTDNDFLMRHVAQPAHIWTVSAAGGDDKRLTSGSWSLPQGQFASTIDWSADGKTIAFQMVPDTVSADFEKGAVALVDVATGKVRPFGANSGWSGNPVFSPDGKMLAFDVAINGTPYLQNEVEVSPVANPGAVDITQALDRNVSPLAWTPDGKGVLVTGDDNTHAALWMQPLSGGAATRIDLGDLSVGSATIAKDGGIALWGETGTRPSELYYIPPHSSDVKRLTDFNHAISSLDLGKTSTVTWTSSDGFAEDGVLTYPPSFDPAKKYPLVLMIHGGPIAASNETFDDTLGLQQIAAARGWVVFEPNYRGSDNEGDKFIQAIVGHVASGPGMDNLEGVAAVEKLGFVDRSRIGVSGWSGGGLATTWLVGHSHIWKAAVAGAAVTNWMDEYSLSDVQGLTTTLLGGSPFDPKYRAEALAESPITYARDVTTPTLVLSDTGDYRVPTPQAFEFYHALKDNGVDTRFVMAPRYGHFPSDPAGTESMFKLWIGWFEDHLK
ncbi:MAG TPA: S9 family peptidase [Candidatus Eremiobacteraceae bacterium]|nr:S9 family peptidase [Candidatus Eremiobacteraceae bacterium]